MERNSLALLIQENPADGSAIRQAVGGESRLKLQCVERMATGLARIAGGGVDVVILDFSSPKAPEIELLNQLLTLRSAALQIPVIVVCDSEADGLLMRALRAGTADHVAKERCGTDLRPLIHSALLRPPAQRTARLERIPAKQRAATRVMLLGGKGGVGTTTVALNLATVLAQTKRVVLAEVQPMFGTLAHYFHPYQGARNITQLLRMDPAAIGPVEVEACLWQHKTVPGLNVLFGPMTAEQCGEIEPGRARAISHALSTLADYAVLDLPATLSEANHAIVQDADALVVVVERDPFSVQSGKRVLETIRSWNPTPSLLGSVVVNRVPLASPPDLAGIEIEMGIPTLAVVPPAPDLCLAAQRAGTPVVLFEADSLAARSLTGLAQKIAPGC